MLVFIFEYSSANNTVVISRPSNVVRSFQQRQLLSGQQGAIVALSLHGHIFFGSAVRILREVKQAVIVPVLYSDNRNSSSTKSVHDLRDVASDGRGRNNSTTSATSTSSSKINKLKFDFNDEDSSVYHNGKQRLRRLDEDSMNAPESLVATRFLVLDCSSVSGLDATSARTCFVALHQILQQYGITMVLTDLPTRMAQLLRAHKVLADEVSGQGVCFALPTLEDALEWCEDMLLEDLISHGAMCSTSRGLTSILASYLDSYPFKVDLTRVSRYVTRREFGPGETMFSDGDTSDTVYFVESGQVALYLPPSRVSKAGSAKKVRRSCGVIGVLVLPTHFPSYMCITFPSSPFLFLRNFRKGDWRGCGRPFRSAASARWYLIPLRFV